MANNGHTPTPTPIEGVPVGIAFADRSGRYRRRRSDRGWRHWLPVVGKVAGAIVAIASTAYGVATHYFVTREDWTKARQEDSEFRGYVRATLEDLRNTAERIERTHR